MATTKEPPPAPAESERIRLVGDTPVREPIPKWESRIFRIEVDGRKYDHVADDAEGRWIYRYQGGV